MIPSGRFVFAAMLLVVLFGSGQTMAGPPFVTDDPDTTEYRHWEIDVVAANYSHVNREDFSQLPALEVDYGLIPDVQLHIIAPLAYDRMPGGHSHYGYGDTELGVKYRFFHETDTLPEIGVFPLVEAPTGDSGRGLGNGQTQIFAPIWLQKSFSLGGKDKDWTSFGGGGFWYNPGRDHRNYCFMGWELQHDLCEHFTLGAEVFHTTPMDVGGQGRTSFNVGGYLNFDEHNHIILSAGRDIDGPGRFACYLAYQLTF